MLQFKLRLPVLAFVAAICVLISCAEAWAQSAGTPARNPRLEGLVTVATQMRTVGILDASRINGFFVSAKSAPSHPPLKLSVADLRDQDALKPLWSYFFRGSHLYFGNVKSAQPIIGYYNPIVDAWVMTLWRFEQQAPVLTNARVIIGESLRHPGQREVSETPGWTDNLLQTTLIRALQKQAVGSAAAFEATYPTDDDQPAGLPKVSYQAEDGRRLLLQRLSTFLETVVAFDQNDAFNQVQLSAFEKLAKGDVVGLTKMMGHAAAKESPLQVVASLPKDIRTPLVTLLVVQYKKDAVIVSANPMQARHVVINRLVNKTGAGATLAALSAMDVYSELR